MSGGRQRSLERKLFVTIARAHNLPVNQSKGKQQTDGQTKSTDKHRRNQTEEEDEKEEKDTILPLFLRSIIV